jgi:hypothetical protein
MAAQYPVAQISQSSLDKLHQLIVSLRQWCEDNGVKIRLTHHNHIVIQERKVWRPPEPHPQEEIWVKDLIFIDRGTSIQKCEKGCE